MKTSDCWTAECHREVLERTSEKLWRFVGRNARLAEADELCAAVLNLSKEDLRLLSTIHFLLDPAVERFLDSTAPKILYSLSKTSVRERSIFRGTVRGRFDPGATVKLQSAAGGDPCMLAVWSRSSRFDLPENRLLKFLLVRIAELARGTAGATLEHEGLTREECRTWADDVRRIGSKAVRLLRNVYLKQMGDLHSVTWDAVDRAERARGRWYSELAETAKLFLRAFRNSRGFLREVLKRRFLEPLSWDVLYELYVLFEVLEAAESSGWRTVRVGLIGGASRTVAEYERGGDLLRVYYQRLPPEMAQASRYGALLESCGLSFSLRRPDIVLDWTQGRERRFCIIEVKRSASRQYLADGAYKLMGYLRDFEDCMRDIRGVRGILVGWSGLRNSNPPERMNSDIVLAVADTIRYVAAEILGFEQMAAAG